MLGEQSLYAPFIACICPDVVVWPWNGPGTATRMTLQDVAGSEGPATDVRGFSLLRAGPNTDYFGEPKW